MREVSNYASALGEAIGALLEGEIHRDRDKASWICTAHTKLRERYTTIRKSIAVLMGNWSYPSRRLLESFEVELFHISFDEICNVLAHHDIPYNWAENNRQQSQQCWTTFSQLSPRDKELIAEELIAAVENDLRESLEIALDESQPRTVQSVRVVITSNRGETYTYNFSNLQETVTFLASYDQERDMDTSNAPVLLTTSTPLPTNLELAEAIELDEDVELSELDE